ncbi:MAG TPA: stage 0 sporulation protein [Thermoflexia bacterium]|nr:stage 0 sporulation protein [Thermoflexia bacterium]
MNKKETPESKSTAQKHLTVVKVRFQPTGTLYHFLAPLEMELQATSWVVVETMRGLQVGEIIVAEADLPAGLALNDLKPVVRLATGLDMARRQFLRERAAMLSTVAEEKLTELEEKEVKVISVEFTLNGRQAILFYTGKLEAEQSYTTWQHQLSTQFDCQVELRSMGSRDEAKNLGGYGVCGEPRCCSRFLTDFKPISIHMAKAQSISLSPTDITGMCGRLRCCLDYEHQVYKDASKGFPPRKSHVSTPQGRGRVIDWDALKGEIIVEIPPNGPRRARKRHHFKMDEVEVVTQKR